MRKIVNEYISKEYYENLHMYLTFNIIGVFISVFILIILVLFFGIGSILNNILLLIIPIILIVFMMIYIFKYSSILSYVKDGTLIVVDDLDESNVIEVDEYSNLSFNELLRESIYVCSNSTALEGIQITLLEISTIINDRPDLIGAFTWTEYYGLPSILELGIYSEFSDERLLQLISELEDGLTEETKVARNKYNETIDELLIFIRRRGWQFTSLPL